MCASRFAKVCVICVLFLMCVTFLLWSTSDKNQYDGVTDRIRDKLKRGTGNYRLLPHFQNLTSFSQYGQDKYIDEVLNNKRNGFFIEIGGYDGQSLSNTLFLERERGWTGLLIEANPYMLPLIMSVNRKCHVINSCLGQSQTNMTFTLAGPISSANNVINSRHMDRINKETLHSHGNHYNETVTVECYSLLDILDVIGTRHVDYFSLDVEGAELFVLESIDWEKIHIDTFTIETDQQRDKILKFMKGHGYEWLTHFTGDDIFRKTKK